MPIDPNNLPDLKGAVDLGERMREREDLAAMERQAAERAENERQVEQVRSWDRAMTRTFKGIHSRAFRLRQLEREGRRREAESS